MLPLPAIIAQRQTPEAVCAQAPRRGCLTQAI